MRHHVSKLLVTSQISTEVLDPHLTTQANRAGLLEISECIITFLVSGYKSSLEPFQISWQLDVRPAIRYPSVRRQM